MSEPQDALKSSRALWNRERLDLSSDEVLAQLMDRGSLQDWRALFQLMRRGPDASRLRDRVHALVFRVPTARPHFWLAVLAGLGHPVDWSAADVKRLPGEVEI
jgi:hypothetical protein